MKSIFTNAIVLFVVAVFMVFYVAAVLLMPQLWSSNDVTFEYKRWLEDLPILAIAAPVLFALMVVGMIAWFRPEGKMLSLIVGVLIVGLVSAFYIPMALLLRPFFKWFVVLIPVMSVALYYVGMMYINDAKSVHWLWATFLGLLRTSVYLILSVVFLLPGCQHSETTKTESKVLVLLDVSGSMNVIDDFPEPGQDPSTLPSRQDKILKFLLSKADADGRDKTPFLEQLLTKSPLTCFRFGGMLDETEPMHLHGDAEKKKGYTDEIVTRWLKPRKEDIPQPNVDQLNEDDRKDRLSKYARRLDQIDVLKSGTNIGAAALQAMKIENSSYVQAIIIVSDGQSNLGSDEDRVNFLQRVNQPGKQIPVLTVGVGQFRLPAAIRIDDIQAPEETRPDDKFPIRVPVVGTNLHDEKFNVTLEIKRVKDVTGKPVEEQGFKLGPKEGKFQGVGDHPQDVVTFEIDVQDLKKIKADKDVNHELEGEWHVVARVPRNPKEPFPDPEHVTEPIKIQIQKRALRILLFASGATREYQFVRSILYRETVEKRMEFSICNQQNFKDDHVDQDVPPERMLQDFPDRIGPNEPGKQYMSLSDYDVVICFDPDWTKLQVRQLNTLKEWVGTHGGGVIFVAGPIFTYQLIRPGGRDLSGLQAIFPVVVQDNRLHNVHLGKLGHDATRPYALNFPISAAQFDFLKLEEEDKNPIAGWKSFFWNDEKKIPAAEERPKRGFFTYYPVERIKPQTQVAATFAGPKEARINGGKDDPPFIATMPFGAGKTMYLGSGEFWRLRAFKDGYHERLWIKMARHVASSAKMRKKHGTILLARSLPVGNIQFEAQIFGKDLLPLPKDLSPTVLVRRVDKNKDEKAELQSFFLKAKPTDATWEGFFGGTHAIKEPGEYEFQLPIPGTSESLRQNLLVRKPNPELDNVRTDFGYLYQLSSDANALLRALPVESRKEIEAALQIPADIKAGESGPTKKLFFPLSSADTIAKCIVQRKPSESTVKGRFVDVWDTGTQSNSIMPIWAAVMLMLAGIAVVGVLVLLVMRQWIAALVFFGICALMAGAVGGTALILENFQTELPVDFSYLLLGIVSILGIEWLARKLLRLA